jgi:hypothetical protein
VFDNTYGLIEVLYDWHRAITFFYVENPINVFYGLMFGNKVDVNYENKIKNMNSDLFGTIEDIRDALSIPPAYTILNDDEKIIKEEEIIHLNQNLLNSFKFMQTPKELPFVESDKFPTVENYSFNDIKYLKKTNIALR